MDNTVASSFLRPFRSKLDAWRPPQGRLARVGSGVLERVLAFPLLSEVHQRAVALGGDRPFCERALEALDVHVSVLEEDLARIPGAGPLVVVANHPFGALDGLILTAMLQRVRRDVKVMANHLLRVVPELRESMIAVDPYGGPGAAAKNTPSMRSALRFVRSGGALAVFPAGEVSHLDPRSGAVADTAWSPSIAWLIRKSAALVLPVFFRGQNGPLFYWAGRVHRRLGSVLLPRELLRQRGRTVRVSVGSPVRVARTREFSGDQELAAYLRVRTYLLRERGEADAGSDATPRTSPQEFIAGEEPADSVEREIVALPAENRLAQSGACEVVFGNARQFNAVLREIGRLREIAFRKVGEGSGKERDLDEFDLHYLHLLVWNGADKQIVGAYRLGLTDQILRTVGRRGLYTSTLFQLGDWLLAQISPAIELGRSFVRPENQKEYMPLMLLWKGIAHFVERNPRYRHLFGPVSISNQYRALSRQLLVTFLRHHALETGMAQWVTPRNPPKPWQGRDRAVKWAGMIAKSVDALDELVAEIERNRTGMPVLLRHYLRLNAKLLGFNLDPAFSDVLDSLMLVDLLDVDRSILARYMGRQQLNAYYRFHGKVLQEVS